MTNHGKKNSNKKKKKTKKKKTKKKKKNKDRPQSHTNAPHKSQAKTVSLSQIFMIVRRLFRM